MTPQCPRCQSDPQPKDFGSPRRCAFPSGEFSPENWNCATVNALLEDEDKVVTHFGSDETMQTLMLPENIGGWLVFTRYKRRGRTSGLVWVGDFYPARPVDLRFCDKVLRARQEAQEDIPR